MDRYTLVATKVAPAGMAQGHVPDFAGAIPPVHGQDPGRSWSGDLYTTGAPTDPGAAYARFAGEGVSAWLDKQADGTLVGWVQENDQVWRYIDPTTWAADVDAAQMTREGGDAPTGDEALTDEAVIPDTEVPANQAGTDMSPPVHDQPDAANPLLADDAEDMNAAAAGENDTAIADQEATDAGQVMPQDPTVDPELETPAPVEAAEPTAEPTDATAPEGDAAVDTETDTAPDAGADTEADTESDAGDDEDFELPAEAKGDDELDLDVPAGQKDAEANDGDAKPDAEGDENPDAEADTDKDTESDTDADTDADTKTDDEGDEKPTDEPAEDDEDDEDLPYFVKKKSKK